MDTPEYPGWVEKTVRERFLVVWGSEAEDVRVGDRPSSQPCSHNVPVDTHDSGYGPPIGIQCAGRVVRLCLYAEAPVIVPCDYSGVIVEDTE